MMIVQHGVFILDVIMTVSFICSFVIFVKRRLANSGVFSTAYPFEVIFLSLSVGVFLCASFISIYIEMIPSFEQYKIDKTFPWSLITTFIAGPATMLIVYWKHLSSINERINNATSMLASEKLTQRTSALYCIDRIAKDDYSSIPMIIEILCSHVRSLYIIDKTDKNEERSFEVKLYIDMISRLWHNHLSDGVSWNYKEKLSPDMRNINLSKLELWKVNLNRFFMENVNFSGCYLCHANMENSLLWRTNFYNADMDSVNLKDAQVYGADFSMANNLTQDQLNSCYGNFATKIPSYLRMPENWKKWRLDNHDKCHFRDYCCGLRCQDANEKINPCIVAQRVE